MTANQINYARQQEEKRHNIVSEGVERTKAGAQVSQAQTARLSQQETARHNQQQESVNWFQAQEVQRHNIEQEVYNRDVVVEQRRHNQSTEAQAASQLAESFRHNLEMEQESHRHNYEQEVLQDRQQQAQHASQAYGLMLQDRSLSEQQRHNQAQEAETSRYNTLVAGLRGQEIENLRSYQVGSLENQRLSAQAAYLGSSASMTSAQAAQYNAAVRESELAESMRRTDLQAMETQRHNLVQESIQQQQADAASERSAASMRDAATREKQLGINREELNIKRAQTAINAGKAIGESIIGGFRIIGGVK